MADGTISLEEGLGFKAIDSNEIRRKQRGISSSAAFETHKPFDLCPASSSGSGPITTIPSKQSSPSRKLQQAFFEEGLILEAEERARLQQKKKRCNTFPKHS
ncbi:hypothetical protein RHMOL_Rhmol09G0133000 [Rhododendron molle]|uniref:Uncharacterized protein n=1 Tax=Rhododendron molle TaxID=49168 RepID=A0ACC0ME66_RHOML|nr:hypothetical protein RHMOL_Rhmol09G0133000 [Rhododendron molle]